MRRSGLQRLVGLACCAALMTAPVSASGLTLSSPRRDVLYTADLDAVLGSTDPTGTVSILAGGHAFSPQSAVPGSTLTWRALRLPFGPLSVVAAVRTASGIWYSTPVSLNVWQKPEAPKLVTPSGGYATTKQTITMKPGAGTTRLELYLNGSHVRGKDVAAGKDVSMGQVTLPKGTSTLKVVATNPVASTETTFKLKRLEFPWATCIVIDKSDYKLYWVKDGELVKAYPIAHGKNDCTPEATWRIDAKYHTDPSSVYGPRKMRMFRKSGSSYVYTAYAIHGTNQPWVIGTMASHGCIRMYNKDVLELFPQVPLGTMVQTRR